MSSRVRLLGRSERAAHALVYLLDDTHQWVSYVMEEIFLHIDMRPGVRRPGPTTWPPTSTGRSPRTPRCPSTLPCRVPYSCAKRIGREAGSIRTVERVRTLPLDHPGIADHRSPGRFLWWMAQGAVAHARWGACSSASSG